MLLPPPHGEVGVELSEVVPGRRVAVLLLQTHLLEAPVVTCILFFIGFSQEWNGNMVKSVLW